MRLPLGSCTKSTVPSAWNWVIAPSVFRTVKTPPPLAVNTPWSPARAKYPPRLSGWNNRCDPPGALIVTDPSEDAANLLNHPSVHDQPRPSGPIVYRPASVEENERSNLNGNPVVGEFASVALASCGRRLKP